MKKLQPAFNHLCNHNQNDIIIKLQLNGGHFLTSERRYESRDVTGHWPHAWRDSQHLVAKEGRSSRTRSTGSGIWIWISFGVEFRFSGEPRAGVHPLDTPSAVRGPQSPVPHTPNTHTHPNWGTPPSIPSFAMIAVIEEIP